MPEEQGDPTLTVRTLLPLGITVRPLTVHRNGLHHGTTTLGRMRPIVGGYRPIHKNGALPPPRKEKENGGRLSSHLRSGNLEIPRTPHGYRLGPQLLIHLRNMARISAAIWHPPKDVDGLPPPNRRANGTPQSDNRGVPPSIRRPRARQLGRPAPDGRVAYNNSITMGNGMSPFYTNYGFHPVSSDPATTGPLNPASKLYAHWMHAVHKASAERLEAAHERMRRYTDPQRTKPPEYQIGDLVMLNGCNIKTRRPSRKLDHKNHGPFQVEKIVSPLAVRITLPQKWKIHNVFHVSLHEPYRTSGHRAPPDPSKILREADDIEQSEEYDVDEVLGSTRKGRRVLYLVKWLDYPDRKDWTEEPYDNFSVGGLEKLREFHQRNPDAPRDYRLTEG